MLASRDIIISAINMCVWEAYRDNERVWGQDLTVGPHSIDVTLSRNFMLQVASDVPSTRVCGGNLLIDPYLPEDEQPITYAPFSGDFYDLAPGDFILGCTRERFITANPISYLNETRSGYFTQMYDGRSTMGRLGVLSHVTAGYGDFGFDGNFTLEIANVGTAAIRLHAGMRIGQISFHETACLHEGIPPAVYSGSYVYQRGFPAAPRLGRESFVNKSES